MFATLDPQVQVALIGAASTVASVVIASIFKLLFDIRKGNTDIHRLVNAARDEALAQIATLSRRIAQLLPDDAAAQAAAARAEREVRR